MQKHFVFGVMTAEGRERLENASVSFYCFGSEPSRDTGSFTRRGRGSSYSFNRKLPYITISSFYAYDFHSDSPIVCALRHGQMSVHITKYCGWLLFP